MKNFFATKMANRQMNQSSPPSPPDPNPQIPGLPKEPLSLNPPGITTTSSVSVIDLSGAWNRFLSVCRRVGLVRVGILLALLCAPIAVHFYRKAEVSETEKVAKTLTAIPDESRIEKSNPVTFQPWRWK